MIFKEVVTEQSKTEAEPNMSEHEQPDVPEIFTKQVVRQLPPEELETRILSFLSSRRLCVLSTCRENVPRSTPILFRTKGFSLYMAGEPGQKLGNIKLNPRVSVAVFDPKSEFSEDILDITGLQITGQARLIGKDESGFMDAFRLFNRPEAWAAHWFGMMIEVVPDRIEMLSMALKSENYAARQIWTRLDL
ncbi:pyridoxamine 5'-phosphate oxidase-related FMN-binding [Chlorobium limicola DSM 245]|uniref:Pyridoxamine 5'-phosphate oxidase-related FMN-binding n=2 Tax=Chlorobium limicola TaxID=1092 RepID=B3ECC5_CHLL2|nr:pyridoxamine 5'-phosphate oxidase-related FMN-binding [Chlorobium limicola DSM 245]